MFEFAKHLFRVQFLLIIVAVGVGVYYNEIVQHLRNVVEVQQRESTKSSLSQSEAETEPKPSEIFTREQLALYNGQNGDGLLYLAILGNVYDVTKGAKHYGDGCSYNFFVGRDASVSFISGEFEEYDPKSADDVVEKLELRDLLSLDNWKRFYDSDYTYKGKLIGRFYDEQGEPTTYNYKYQFLLDKAREEKTEAEKLRTTYPDCNIEWSQERGTRVWCTKTSGGGPARNWIGYPRKIYAVGGDSFRCACIKEEELEDSKKMFKAYDNCEKLSQECYYNVD